MEGKKVKIQLHTPILVATPRDEGPSHYEQAVQSISGRVLKLLEAGILIAVEQCTGERGEAFAAPFTELFLPHHKIDHIYLI
jgi:hypothetical protein